MKRAVLVVLFGCGATTPTASVGGVIVVKTPILGQPIPNAQVCVHQDQQNTCSITDESGEYSFEFPYTMNQEVAISVNGSGYLGTTVLQEEEQQPSDHGATGWPSTMWMYTLSDAVALLGDDAGFEYPGSGGFLSVDVDLGTQTGATVTVTPVDGGQSGEGPVYGDATNTPSTDLTGTSSSGGAWFGNLTAGLYDVTVSAPTSSLACSTAPGNEPGFEGWPPTIPGTAARVEVMDGALTTGINVACH